ncbi:glycosyltransferase [Agromyces atrinae]|uniref:UDP-N-acetylglucosamine transferase subunit ALG13 n=1 Tax=Agromyces atrinae TaxID=592376 RepID=A0A852SLV1_9MICO|nr:glycosyltransferase [Agromyces atrinae]NYD68507.1 UDP-N-acetylglucosamine transferase subunit ALG13 [Agromyces atrinae]
MSSDARPSRKLLLAASTGGHLAQLARLAPYLGASDDSLWVTFRTPQSESLLAGKRVHYVPYIASRDFRRAIGAARQMRRLLDSESFEAAVSTGAALAVSVLPVAKSRGIETTYIESVSRVNGPSLSGRIIAATRSAELFTQHHGWADHRWQPHRSVLESFTSIEQSPVENPSLFVTLGTIKKYRFDSVVDQVLASGLADDRTVWQLGETYGRTDLPGRVFQQVSGADFEKYSLEADAVISHAGVGSLLALLELGIFPVLVTRRRVRNEHVDDHQLQIADLVNSLDIARAVDGPDLDAETIISASARSIVPSDMVNA